MTEKLTKKSVNYSQGKPNAHCGICTHFERPHSCAIVEGEIHPDMWCERFKAKGKARARYGR